MKWEYIKATEFCESVRDGTHDTPRQVEMGYKLVTGKHIRNGVIDPTDAYYISERDYEKINERSRVDQWDVLMSMIGNGLGRTAVVKDTPEYAIKNIALFKTGDEIKAKWLQYYLSGPDGQGLIYGSLQGSGQPFISLSYLRDFPIPNPPISVMSKVVAVLEKYDDLIENNQKQIKLLEEAAQRLYKEWFVDLRFPGYEKTNIIDEVPEGWKKEPLGKALQVVRGRSYSSKELSENEGLLMVNLSNIRPFGGYNRNQEKHYTGKVKEDQFVETHDLLMGVTDMTQERRTVGRVAIVPNLHSKAMISMDLIKLVPIEGSTLFYYALLNYGGYSEVISRFANGTNVLHLRPEALDIVDAVIPDISLQRKFVDYFENIQNKVDALQDEIIIAAEARDRLLPKLMSGEVEV